MEFFWIWLYFMFAKFTSIAIHGIWILALLLCFFTFLVTVDPNKTKEEMEQTVKDLSILFKRYVVCSIVLLLMWSAVPDKEELGWIVGGGVALKISQMEEAQKIPDSVLGAANRFLESIAEETKE